MKTTYFLQKHSRGNHSAQQVYFHGNTIINGTKKECSAELVRMRKFLRDKYCETSTNDTIKDFIKYEMANIFFVKKQDNTINYVY